jgi:predicted transcriptional regulator
MRKVAKVETLIDILNIGKKPQHNYQLCSNVGLPYSVGKPVLDEMLRRGLIETVGNEKITSEKGRKYIHDFNELNKKYGTESIMKLIEEKKAEINQKRSARQCK